MLDVNASSFSYGEQRLLSLARLLMGNDRLLLLDEPTSGVNPVYIRTIEKMIREMVEIEGITVPPSGSADPLYIIGLCWWHGTKYHRRQVADVDPHFQRRGTGQYVRRRQIFSIDKTLFQFLTFLTPQ